MPTGIESFTKKNKQMKFENVDKVFTLDEGSENRPYKDSQEYWTIGKGHLIGANLENLYLSDHVINEIFKEDIEKTIKFAKDSVGEEFFEQLCEPRKIAILSMLFTLGPNKWEKFFETKEAIKACDWEEVSKRILQSKWAKDVDPKQRPDQGRDDRIAYMFKYGKFHPDYKIKE